jgi:hypothetical protein
MKMESSTTNTRFTPSQKRISVRDLAYAAAMVDAEGYILGSVYHHPNGKQPYGATRVAITNTDMRLHNWLIETFGGTTTRRRKGNHLSKKDCYDWTPGTGNTLWFLKLVRRFLKLKQQQADCAIAFLSLPYGSAVKKVHLAEKIHRLNRGMIESSPTAT